MFTYLRILLTARRMGLRDKGPIEKVWKRHGPEGEYFQLTSHTYCNTRVRIGIDKQTGERVRYCWRCETLLDREVPPPQGKEPIPVPIKTSAHVIPLPQKKNA